MNNKGFTLIELLIVVAIIGILAAIAIPNFLNAQTRAKIAKSKAEMQTVTTCIESYNVDHNVYPVPYKHPAAPANWHYNVPNSLSTPIAYCANAESFYDPFSLHQTDDPDNIYYQFHRYGLINMDYTKKSGYPYAIDPTYEEVIGKWRMDGYGPAKIWGKDGWIWGCTYDPTNGTISKGALLRSQKQSDHRQSDLP